MAGEVKLDTSELEAAFAKVAGSDLRPADLAAAEALIPAIAQRTPVRTGRLAGSWSATSTPAGAVVESDEEYAGVIEYGDPERGIEGAHMAADALAASEEELGRAYEEELARVFRRAGFEVRS